MTRQELIAYIFDEYSVEPDFPFRMDDVTCVFRHIDNRKWFGIAMVIPYRTVGINKPGDVDILNVKCDPIMMGSLRGKSGFCPAYHMNNKYATVIVERFHLDYPDQEITVLRDGKTLSYTEVAQNENAQAHA